MKNKDVSIVVISDIHLGILDVNECFEILEKRFINYCKEKKPDIIVLNGDITHSQVSLNSLVAKIFYKFINMLIELNTTILYVNGTRSHDADQIDSFAFKISDKFRIYKNATIDYIHGLKLLILPEEYIISDKIESYYKDLINQKYDYVFGHGTFSHVSYIHNINKMNVKKLTSKTWDYERDFKDKIYGSIVFGHIHTYDNLDKFYYTGSFFRFCHNEEEDKGFMHFIYNKEKRENESVNFIINEDAKVFKTVLESYLSDDRDDLIQELESYANSAFKLRIKLDRKITPERKSDIITFTKSYLNTSIDAYYDKKIKMKIIEDCSVNNLMIQNKYEGMDIIDATIEFILEKHNVSLSRETITKILNSSDVKI